MEASRQRKLTDGRQYDALIDPAKGTVTMLSKGGATVFDTIKTIKAVVDDSRSQVKALAKHLSGASLEQTCHRIWNFIYDHIQYKIDTPGTEQVRSPARTWADRVTGVDCDCYSTFISCILSNLGIPHVLRMTAYRQHSTSIPTLRPWQHVYVIVVTDQQTYQREPLNSDSYITLDCVKDEFNAEHGPITAYQDFPMNLARLDGLADTSYQNIGADDYTVDGLGRVVRRRGAKTKAVDAKVVPKPGAQPAVVPAPTTAAPVAHQLAPNTSAYMVRPRMKGQETPGQRKFFMGPKAPFSRTQLVSENEGTLKSGITVALGEEIKTEYFNNIFPGSTNGYTFYNRVLLRNGRPTGDKLMRFWVIDGVLKGHDVQGRYYTDFGDGNLRLIPGAKVWNPGVSLGAIGPAWEINEGGELRSKLDGVFDTYGLMIDADYARRQLSRRKEKLGLSGTSLYDLDGMGSLAAILGDYLDNPAFIEQVYRIPVGGADDINGVCGLSGGFTALEGAEMIGSLAEALDNQGEGIILLDGLGRTRRATGRRAASRKTVSKPTAAAQQTEANQPVPAATATNAGKSLPIYIPANTLRNLLQLRSLHIARLNSNGHNFPNDLSLNGGLGDLGELGFWGNLMKDIGRTFSSQNLLKVAASATNFIPVVGGAVNSVVSPIVNNAIDADNARGQQQSQGEPVQPVPQQGGQGSPVQLAPAIRIGDEDTRAYNDALSGLGSTGFNPLDWVKANPGTAIAIGAVGAYLGYRAFTGGSTTRTRSRPLSGTTRKKSSSGKTTKGGKKGSAAKGSTHKANPFKI